MSCDFQWLTIFSDTAQHEIIRCKIYYLMYQLKVILLCSSALTSHKNIILVHKNKQQNVSTTQIKIFIILTTQESIIKIII